MIGRGRVNGFVYRHSDHPRMPGRRHFDGCGVDLPRNAWRGKVIELLERFGLKADHIDRYPHQYSGQTIFRPLPLLP
ncbi:hypothetical protein ELG83_24610 (plasmid) [Rhizobium leguminosarum]|uniref:hypothetical protein n=1 Tax=Rhizobium TaxID=379 RepID=UPI00102F5310|nr:MULTISPECIES: hypothetical protein [Rhizobium]TBF24894.1 hypothetical protein ELG88_33890 [Rhizobium leguminosarum]TBF88031.1 hypothetical protein ELG83_24610 [Rhizobium leguminosarum]WSH48611.1 hypothetical protein U8P77_35455 [Rhizobium johnstonii]